MNTNRMNSREKGISIPEVIVVITVIMILGGVGVATMRNLVAHQRDLAAKSTPHVSDSARTPRNIPPRTESIETELNTLLIQLRGTKS